MRTASCKTSRGLDVFEVLTRGDGPVSILMADLSSKGKLAHVHSNTLRSAFARFAEDERHPARILAMLNRLKRELPSPESDVAFAAAFVATFEKGSHSMLYASAGHELAMIVGRQRSHRRLATTGPLIGVLPDPLFAERKEPLSEDDLVVLVTDGVTECRHPYEETLRFGTSGIVCALASARNRDPLAAHDAIARSLDQFGGGYYRDDASVAVLAAR